MFKKILVVVLVVLLVLIGIFVYDEMNENIHIKEIILTFFDLGEYKDLHLDQNINFKPAAIDGFLKKASANGECRYTMLHYKDTIIEAPIYSNDYRKTFYDTAYSIDGSVYMALSKNDVPYRVDKAIAKEYELGYGQPAIIEVMFPETDVVLYVQCYTPESYGFYSSYDWTDVYCYVNSDLEKSSEELASITNIPNNIQYINGYEIPEDYLSIVNEYTSTNEDGITVGEYNGVRFSYHKAIGFVEDYVKVEYARLTKMGYEAIACGEYNGVSYIQFDRVVVLFSRLTKNSCIIYHIEV